MECLIKQIKKFFSSITQANIGYLALVLKGESTLFISPHFKMIM